MKALNLNNDTIVSPTDDYPFYTVNGDPHIRVSSILDCWTPPDLKNWFIKTSAKKISEKRNATATHGSKEHAAAQTGKSDRLNVLLAKLNATLVTSECVVWSKNGWAGTADLVMHMNGKNYLIDIKTGRFGQVFAQLGGYSLAANERGWNIEGVGVISIPREKPEEEAQFFDYSKHMEDGQIQWCEIFDYWKWTDGNFKKLKDWKFLENPKRAVFAYNWQHQNYEDDGLSDHEKYGVSKFDKMNLVVLSSLSQCCKCATKLIAGFQVILFERKHFCKTECFETSKELSDWKAKKRKKGK